MPPRTAILLLLLLPACSGRDFPFGDPDDMGADGDAPIFDAADLTPPGAEVGDPCSGPTDCTEDALCIGNADGTFECMANCAVPYEVCGDGSVCLPVMTQDAAICYVGGAANARQECGNNLDCAPGLLCFGAAAEFYCRAACAPDVPCGEDEYCLELSSGAGLCRGITGAACVGSSACSDGRSCSDEDPDLSAIFPGGYCTADCSRDTDCDSRAVCRRLVNLDRSICLSSCDHVSDCRFNGSYECLDASACDGSSDPDACRTLFGEDSLCVPGPF